MPTGEYLSHLDAEDYKPCISYLEKKNSKESNNDRIRDNFDLAMMKHYQKEYDSSLAILNETDQLMENAVTKSITKGFASAVANDNATEYTGTPYEYIYLNVFNALNYYNNGNVEEAAVEVRRLNEKQQKYLAEYGEWITNSDSKIEISDMYTRLRLDTTKVSQFAPKNPTDADIFRDSATARYLSIVFAQMDESVNNSWNISSDARTLKALNPSFNTDAETHISDGMGRLDILAFSGLIGRRGERRIIIGPFPGIQFPTSRNFTIAQIEDMAELKIENPTNNSAFACYVVIKNLSNDAVQIQNSLRGSILPCYSRGAVNGRRDLLEPVYSIAAGTSAVICLEKEERLFVANEHNGKNCQIQIQFAKGYAYEYIFDGSERHLSIRKFSEKIKRAAYERQNHCCKKCGKHYPIEKMHADHIVPWSKGGRTVEENCQVLCENCNREKSNK